jgi:hypothetical protein
MRLPVSPGWAARSSALDIPSGFRLTDQPRDERHHGGAGSDVLANLYAQNVGARHLLVEELDDAAQLTWDDIGDKHEPQAPGMQVRRDFLPEPFGVPICSDVRGEVNVRVSTGVTPRDLVSAADPVDRPVRGSVRGIVEHLANDLATDPGVTTSLDLNECRNAILIEKEVVEAPAASCVRLVAEPDLTLDKQPALALITVLFADQEIWIAP